MRTSHTSFPSKSHFLIFSWANIHPHIILNTLKCSKWAKPLQQTSPITSHPSLQLPETIPPIVHSIQAYIKSQFRRIYSNGNLSPAKFETAMPTEEQEPLSLPPNFYHSLLLGTSSGQVSNP